MWERERDYSLLSLYQSIDLSLHLRKIPEAGGRFTQMDYKEGFELTLAWNSVYSHQLGNLVVHKDSAVG